MTTTRGLKRDLNEMPEDIGALLASRGLAEAYSARPAYQRNDYLGWIGRAKRDETRQRRINQMLAELKAGDSYMKMNWSAGEKD
jgi:uncharacterized protein YdeI (YjbR/CyaY-like superfamily)